MTHILAVTGVKSDHTNVFYEAFLKVIQNNNSGVCVCVCVCVCEAVIQHLAMNSKVTPNYEKKNEEGCCRTIVLTRWF